jgi:hypothetical protein
MRALAIALLLVGAQAAGDPQREVELQAELEADSARVGEVVLLRVSVGPVPPGAEVAFPTLPDTGAVTALAPPASLDDGGGTTRSALYRLTAWQVGDLGLPGAVVRVRGAGFELELPLPDLVLHVKPVLPAGADPDTLAWRPAADVVGPNWSLAEKIAAAGLALAALLGALFYVWRRGRSVPVPVPPGPEPRKRALAALGWLEESGLAEVGEVKAFYSALSQIVREFLAATEPRWGLDLTTPELIAAVGADGVEPARVTALGELLVSADLVKFARRRPSAAIAAEALEAARDWIAGLERAPSPREPEPAAAPAASVTGGEGAAGEAERQGEAARSDPLRALEALLSDGWAVEPGSTEDDRERP